MRESLFIMIGKMIRGFVSKRKMLENKLELPGGKFVEISGPGRGIDLSWTTASENYPHFETGYSLAQLQEISSEEIQEEFTAFTQITEDDEHLSSKISLTPSFEEKNRYHTVIPCNFHTDPYNILKIPSVDYINASFIDGWVLPDEENYFIATQGPLLNTIEHFWEMVYEYNRDCIIMLCKYDDRSKRTQKLKCEKYYPTEGEERHGNFFLEVVGKEVFNGVEKTELMLEFEGNSRIVSHYLYLDWPDHQSPRNLPGLYWLVDEVEKYEKPLVHCSAGVGRTGTFLAMRNLKMMIDAGAEKLSVFSLLRRMREERIHMVETISQYQIIYNFIKEKIKGII